MYVRSVALCDAGCMEYYMTDDVFAKARKHRNIFYYYFNKFIINSCFICTFCQYE